VVTEASSRSSSGTGKTSTSTTITPTTTTTAIATTTTTILHHSLPSYPPPSLLLSGLKVGSRVFLPQTKGFGFVRFLGETHFANDVWVGIELDAPKGKNSGDVQVGGGLLLLLLLLLQHQKHGWRRNEVGHTIGRKIISFYFFPMWGFCLHFHTNSLFNYYYYYYYYYYWKFPCWLVSIEASI